MALPPRDLGIGEVAARTGLSVPTLRFYETRGLVKPLRTSGGQRRYLRADLRRLSIIRVATDLGFSLAEVGAVLDRLPPGRAATQADWNRIARHFRRELDRRIRGMERLRERLDGCIGCGCLSMKRCALFNRDDEAAAEGPGSRLWREIGGDDHAEGPAR
ncbi:redox-sensitive transcriptional activator SoxR [Frigidibacter sp. ROC022]|uniref:redox-sensitive transcriptional activator SoxR n=1 Tax=Frigidibacter sp. ROC022 TaxID=2971796 RepID=UPI00215AF3CE|nr:redox-sensitive transcriptional activator SoxR [Frigidibacter sp. ROC022]MCR8723254.1 redox-sensitive transcriptional activator SoxR [Frigidibacter sp. ROC022]